jgi:hypothetical protein
VPPCLLADPLCLKNAVFPITAKDGVFVCADGAKNNLGMKKARSQTARAF